MTKRAYYRKWRKAHPNYKREYYKRQHSFVVILGVKCRWRYLP